LFDTLFASLHLEAALFLAIFILAVLPCQPFGRTGSLSTPMAAHETFNSFTVAGLVLSGPGLLPEL
jgi:membrane protease YdiL (CAAX protease family)